MRGIFLKDELKQSQMYMPTCKLHTKILEELHNVPMARHQGEKIIHTELGKSFY
jgi:hypothetical protein